MEPSVNHRGGAPHFHRNSRFQSRHKSLEKRKQPAMLVLCILFLQLALPASALEFIFNSFAAGTAANLTLTDDARLVPPVIRLTNDSNQFSLGRAFYPARIPFKPSNSSNITTSFSTQFVFSILPEISTSPGFGLAFVISNSTSPPDALASQYFGLFSGARTPSVAPLVAIEFDTAGYYNGTGALVPVDMRNGQNIHAWIEFNGPKNEINVTIAPAGMPRPARTMLSYRNPSIANYLGPEMFVGFSASKTQWVEAQRVLAWSFSDVGVARDINTTGLPVFMLESSGSSSLSPGAAAGIAVGCVVAVVVVCCLLYWFWWKRRRETKKMMGLRIGKWSIGLTVYKGILANNMEVAVKCVNHDSKQGLREFMAEISSMGRLQHKNLVQMRGWCRKGNELMLVYDYMPNGSLNKWIFDRPNKLLDWEGRKRVLADVAEGLNYLHHGWDQVVVHRDIKSSNVLLDSDMRGRLGDFGLAKLYTHGEVPNTTRVVGTLGYLAPEVVTLAAPTAASDVYSFGVVVLEVVCGRRPIETAVGEYEVEEVEAVLKLGLSCCHPDLSRRPTMREVTAILLGEHAAMEPKELLSELTPTTSFADGGEGGDNEQEKESQLEEQV
ncbi:UNVERIFIED_CONTAM: L-type lectin-domain containing receptor kinase S.1 [Sesamum angustifolium]|uniref:L-type lectin-domain containing receptor kinase S.1 n=1 Tax=Sesamum angustifolium TaxID=2727405 RepID=A0AAW2LII7_9LAMI